MDHVLLQARMAALDAAARSIGGQIHTQAGLLDRAVVFEEWLLRGDVAAEEDEEEGWPSFAETVPLPP